MLQKTRRRLKLFFTGLIIVLCLGTAAYFIRSWQVEKALRADRVAGMAALKAKDYFNAYHKLGSYLQQHGNDVETLFAYAQARTHVEAEQGRHRAEARSLLRRVLALQPAHNEAAKTLLQLYLEDGYNAETIESASKILARDPKDADALRAQVIVLMRQNKFKDALPIAQKLNDAAPLDLEGQIDTLVCMKRLDDKPEALMTRAKAVRDVHPDDVRLEVIQSIAAGLNGDIDAAKKLALSAAQAKTLDAPFVKILVKDLDGLEMFDVSASTLKRAATQTGDVELCRAYSVRLLQNNQWEELATAAPLASLSDPQIRGRRVVALLQLGQRDEAEKILRELEAEKGDLSATTWSQVIRTAAMPQGNTDLAHVIAVCSEAVKREPQASYFRSLLADAYVRAGESDAALQQWQQMMRASPSWSLPLRRLADVLVASGRNDDAITLAQAALLRSPDDPAALFTLLSARAANFRAGDKTDPTGLLQLIDRVEKQNPTEERTIFIRARLLINADGRRDDAVALIRQTINRSPAASTGTLIDLAMLSRASNLSMQKECLDAAEKAHGMDASLAFARAKLTLENGQPKEVIEQYQRYQKSAKNPDDAEWGAGLATLFDQTGDDRAAAEWVAVADKHPDDSRIQWLALSAPSVQKNREFVGRILERLRTLIGDQGVAWRISRARYLLDGQPSGKETIEATLLLNEVSRTNPDLLAPRLLLADCLKRLGNLTGAVEQLTSASNIDPGSAAIALELAQCLQIQGNYEQAKLQLDRVLANPASTMAQRRSAAILLADQGDIAGSIKNLNPDDPSSALALAMVHVRRGEMSKAEELTAKMLQKPDVPSLSFVADFYVLQGRRDDAEKIIAQLDALQAGPGVKEMAKATFYARNGPVDQATKWFEAATNATPRSFDAWRDRITYLFSTNVTNAIAVNKSAMTALPENVAFAAMDRQTSALNPADISADPRVGAMLAWLLRSPGDENTVGDVVKMMVEARKKQMQVATLAAQLRAHADAHLRLFPLQLITAQLCLDAGGSELDDAIRIATRARAAFPKEPEPARVAARALLAAGRPAEALDAGKVWKERAPSAAKDCDELMAIAELQLHRPEDAIKRLKPYEVAALANPEANDRLLQAYAAAQVLQKESSPTAWMVDSLKPLLPKSPAARQAWSQVASQVIPDMKVGAQWLGELTPFIAGKPDEQVGVAWAWFRLAARSGDKSQVEAARTMARDASIELAKQASVPSNTFVVLGSLLEQLEDPMAAEACYRRALAGNARERVAQNNLAMLLIRRAQNGKATSSLQEAASLASQAANSDDPNRGSYFDTLATAQAMMKDYAGAIRSLQSALKIRPDKIVWRVNLICTYHDAGRDNDAKMALLDLDEQIHPTANQVDEETWKRLNEIRRILHPDGAVGAPAATPPDSRLVPRSP